jgi:VWFA-related protein
MSLMASVLNPLHAIALLLAGLGMSGLSHAQGQSREQTVYVSVSNQNGTPVTNLAAEDFIVRENDVEQEVLRVSRPGDPLDIAVLVDTSQDAEPFVPDIRAGLVQFVRATGDRHDIALIGFGRRPTVIVDYVRDPRKLESGANRLFAEAGSGSYLLDAIIETAQGLQRREKTRRAIVIIANDEPEFSNRNAEEVLKAVRQSGATVDVFVITDRVTASRQFDASRTTPMPPGSEATRGLVDQSTRERALALSEAARISGGRREDLLTSAVLGGKLRELAAEFNNEYRIVYARSSFLPSRSVEILTTRPGLKLRTRVPAK